VRLGAEGRPDLVDPLEDADHRLLVELRALREVRRAPEVVQREDVRAALGRGGDDLGRLDLGEAEAVEGGAEAADRGGGDPEAVAHARVAERDGRLVEDRRQLLLQLGPAQLDRRRLRRLGEHAERRALDLDAAGRLRVRDGVALDLEHRLREELHRLVEHDLRHAGAVAEDEERDAAELAPVVKPAGEPHAPADVRAELAREHPLHVFGLLLPSHPVRLSGAGEEASPRCHRSSPPQRPRDRPGHGGQAPARAGVTGPPSTPGRNRTRG
jgi:hypothetical protein